MQRRFWSLLGNSQRLDGGAMFGNAPKALWSRWFEADSENRIDLACRCLLVHERNDGGERWILLETGIGAFFEPSKRERFGVQESRHVLLDALAELGLTDADIDIVVLSHLHFDHAGGLLAEWQDSADRALLFERARFVVGAESWARAQNPHPRDRASFGPELPGLLEATGRLEIVDDKSDSLGDAWSFHRSDGHTPGMLLAECEGPRGPIVFAADLIPGIAWLRRALTMGYDRYPELLIDEKAKLLDDLHARGGMLFFTHDPHAALVSLDRDDRGAIVASEVHEKLVAWEG